MAHNRSRFVLLCQQSLAVALVAALTAPAANLVSLDIVHTPGQGGPATGAPPAVGGGTSAASVVDTTPAQPTVSTVPFTKVTKAGLQALRGRQTSTSATSGSVRLTAYSADVHPAAPTTKARLAALSAPTPTKGLATVGVTWSHSDAVPSGSIAISLRTRQGATWSSWTKIPYHPDEGPDPSSPEGRDARPGTDPIYVGKVDVVQVRALTDSGVAPAGMKISLVDPGTSHTALERPAIDTGAAATNGSIGLTAAETDTTGSTEGTDVSLSSSVTARPYIYSRRQWGADERMRDKPSLHYGQVHGGFVHHTVNANSYTRGQVPSIIRGIYAYHTQSRGWSDIGYNFLVDRFGRIWEGRYGGVDRPVVGAHTLGYNDDAFAMSAIGNFEIARPSSAIVRAFGRLFAWKLGLHGVRAGATRVWVEKRYLHAISGHRDVDQTACPGKYLYARIPDIRQLAASQQRPFANRDRRLNLAGGAGADLVVRDKATRQGFLIRTATDGSVAHITPTGTYFRYANRILSVGDWDRDGNSDVVTRSAATGRLFLYRGDGNGHFRAPILLARTGFGNLRLLAGVGDVTGDGYPDLMGETGQGPMRIYPGAGTSGVRRSYAAHSHISGGQQVGLNLFNNDGALDVLVKRGDGSMTMFPGNGPGGLMSGRGMGSARGYNWIVAIGDVTGDHRSDLIARSSANGRLWLLPSHARSFGPPRAVSANSMNRFDLVG